MPKVSKAVNDELDELEILKMANEKGKFAIPLDERLGRRSQEALERLMDKDWIRLIDVTPLAFDGRPGKFYRVFRVLPPRGR